MSTAPSVGPAQRLERIAGALGHFEPAELAEVRAPAVRALRQILDNALYWQAFDLARFEPLLVHAPPLMSRLGIGILLAFGDAPSGLLDPRALDRASTVFSELPPHLAQPLEDCLQGLRAAVSAREQAAQLIGSLRMCKPSFGCPPAALQSHGRAHFHSADDPSTPWEVRPGQTLTVFVTDDKDRQIRNFTFENPQSAPLWMGKDRGSDAWKVVALIPGSYRFLVHGRAGHRWMHAV